MTDKPETVADVLAEMTSHPHRWSIFKRWANRIERAMAASAVTAESLAERFEAMHARGDVWVTTIAAAVLCRNQPAPPAVPVESLGRDAPPYSAPFTTDVRNCCESPETCPEPCAPPPASVPDGLIDRIKAAEQRIHDGHALRRIPADPTDVDLVLAEVRLFLETGSRPFWIKPTTPEPRT